MGAASGKGFVADINVTPFVDVMLVLLIIFMVTAPLMTAGIEVDLPVTEAAEPLSTESDHLVLSISQDGAVYLDTYLVPIDELIDKLATNVAGQKKQLFLQADKSVPYGVVVDVMGRVRAAGIENLGMIADTVATAPVTSGAPAAPVVGTPQPTPNTAGAR